MPITHEDIDTQLRIIRISGRLDIPGTGEIEGRFAALAATGKQSLVVDLTEVSFLASIGIRLLITNAKAHTQRGGKIGIVAGENTSVQKTLELTGIDSLVPMFNTLDNAKTALEQ